MFQTYSQKSQTHATPARLIALRKIMAEKGISYFLVPRTNAHMGEYVAERDERLAYVTAFTGSAGLAVIGLERACLFVDGRYTLQAGQQVDPSLFEVEEIPEASPLAWLKRHLKEGETVAVDPWLHTPKQLSSYQALCERHSAHLSELSDNLIDIIWHDQPQLPPASLLLYSEELSGESAASKLERVKNKLEENATDALVTAIPEDIAWTFNLRGSDIPHTPVALGFAIIPKSGKAKVFVSEDKITPEVLAARGEVADFLPYETFLNNLNELALKKVWLDEGQTPQKIKRQLENVGAEITPSPSPIALMKAVKNAVELDGFRSAHLRDGVAMAKFLHWFESAVTTSKQTEISAAIQLEAFRAKTGELKDISFDTISGSGPNGAIVHYRVTEDTKREIAADELFLIDSGGQYVDGTTDITRTLIAGTPTADMKRAYTLVLKGHIAVSRARFPKGTTGAQLDVLAREALWAHGMDYAHGTGHGVGHFLSVHEGPHGISKRAHTPLEPGVVLSNEPGFYKQGAYGIRIENLIVVKENEEGWQEFETLTLCPYEQKLIDLSLLEPAEINWINAYHSRVYAALAPHMATEGEKTWLQAATKSL